MRISSPLLRVTLDELRIKFGTRATEFVLIELIFPLRTEVADILEATLRTDRTATDQADSALTKIDRSTYSALSNKLSKGTPSKYFVQRFVEKTVVTLYPTADSTNAAKAAHIYFVKRIQDAGSSRGNLSGSRIWDVGSCILTSATTAVGASASGLTALKPFATVRTEIAFSLQKETTKMLTCTQAPNSSLQEN